MRTLTLALITITVLAFAGCGHHTNSNWPAQPVIQNGTYTVKEFPTASALEIDVTNATPQGAQFDVPSLGISVFLNAGQTVDTGTHVVGFDDCHNIGDNYHELTIDGVVYRLSFPVG